MVPDRLRGDPEPAGGTDSWAIVQHVDHEGAGSIAEVLHRADLPFTVLRPDRGEPLPPPGSLRGLVVMGGPMGVHDDGLPWLARERALLAAVAARGAPVLGICLGAQQLAMALGAEVSAGRTAEIGLGRVELTAHGRLDPVFGPEYGGLAATTVPCVHWHQDTFSLPEGAVHLAASAAYPNQAFRWGDRAYGLQFHVEVDRELAARWRRHLPPGAGLEPVGVAEVAAAGHRLLRRFVDVALRPPVVVAGQRVRGGARPPARGR